MNEQRIIRCWVEDWEKDCIKTNNADSKERLLRKYGGLVIADPDANKVYQFLSDQMYWDRSRGRDGSRWCLVAEPPEYNGTNEEVLEYYEIHDDLLVIIAETEQPRKLNVQKIFRAM